MNTPNYGAPPLGYIPWRPTDVEIEEAKARGRITEAAKWDNMTPEQRAVVRPDFNPNKGWYEQRENRVKRSL